MDMLRRIGAALRLVESGILVVLVTVMVAIAAWQVGARNLFGTGLLWGDGLVRVLVLWVAMVGAMVASRNDEHINIDAVTRHVPERFRRHLKRFANLFTCAVLFTFAWYSLQFVLLEYADEIVAFALVPAWACEVVLPVGGLVMALRYLVHVVAPP
ncbi:MAG: TRAP transporter small permease [Pseudomonadales bacterium]|jgi:TRAP-type C4-dicarboxylate transport system permease small subunit|nr:TRAP transporter small permease [Pseudomonadales bacterium]MDP6470606.1 TRAP transporter small permease [Pseudomonadales bacterium]MDP6828539.1 TRAP transporter small permease [Pseudomonadales bacterium]MDP6972025.1 TRAP transporter small permease [Pseudomonadales bacterium]|tara:strand:- start:736 stop:1203 length:468 start_codon:yes stop_codon:yes gene_type:complete